MVGGGRVGKKEGIEVAGGRRQVEVGGVECLPPATGKRP